MPRSSHDSSRLRTRRTRRGVTLLGRAILALVVGLRFVPRARAEPYDSFLRIADEHDIERALAEQRIGPSSARALRRLLQRGVDLCHATSDELYALPNLTRADVAAILRHRTEHSDRCEPRDLVADGVLSVRRLEAIAAFLVDPTELDARGVQIRLDSTWLVEDWRVPSTFSRARSHEGPFFRSGATIVWRNEGLREVRWSPEHAALVGSAAAPRLRPAKGFAAWDTSRWGIIVGTYAIGFGQRLVFDTTGSSTPRSFVDDLDVVRPRTTRRTCSLASVDGARAACPELRVHRLPDPRVPPSLLGVAGGVHRLDLRRGFLRSYAFASHARRDVYQYDVTRKCRLETLPERCGSPHVLEGPARGASDGLPTRRWTHQDLPGAYDEWVAGGHVGWWANENDHLALTGYGAGARWRISGARLDFAPASKWPSGGRWAAVGFDAGWARDVGRLHYDLALDGAWAWHDARRPEAGGPAGVVRQTLAGVRREIELSMRAYAPEFRNPFARPPAAPDEDLGSRSTDELGLRLRASTTLGPNASGTVFGDVWSPWSRRHPGGRVRVRLDVHPQVPIEGAIWVEGATRDLRSPSLDSCVGSMSGDTPPTPRIDAQRDDRPCGTSRFSGGTRWTYAPHPRVSLGASGRFGAHAPSSRGLELDGAGRLEVEGWLVPERLRTGLEAWISDEALRSLERGASTARFVATARARFAPTVTLTAQYDVRLRFDGRESTALRRPNPEHWLHLQVDLSF